MGCRHISLVIFLLMLDIAPVAAIKTEKSQQVNVVLLGKNGKKSNTLLINYLAYSAIFLLKFPFIFQTVSLWVWKDAPISNPDLSISVFNLELIP